MSSPDVNSNRRSAAEVLRGVHVGLRDDLEVSRHLFRGHVSYILRDPMTFQSQRVSARNYEIIVRIRSAKTLGEVFDELVARETLDSDDEEHFYRFIMSLHGLGFLSLPLSDAKTLYERFRRRRQAVSRSRWFSILFLRVPLWNPSGFLDRTIHLARPLFSVHALVAWALLMCGAGFVAVSRWDELVQPVHGLLVAGNLPVLAATLVVLKVFHEFGHAYACRHFGGHVPEMGTILIMFTPCAYVDATDSWSFPRSRDRIVVCLAGMYVESVIAAVAVFVWALTESSMLNAIAYNVMFLAGAVTVFFNINPLMRYDGYYVLCDLLEIPNLRQRSQRFIRGLAKRIFLGVENVCETATGWLNVALFSYGALVTFYRAALMLTIAAVLSYKMRMLGLIVGACFVAMTAMRLVRSLTRYLWHHEETARVRWRAVALGVFVLIGVPTGLFFLPLPSAAHAAAVVAPVEEVVVRASTPGFVESVDAELGCEVRSGDRLVALTNDSRQDSVVEAEAALRSSMLLREAYIAEDAAKAQQEESRIGALRAVLLEQERQVSRLSINSPSEGTVVSRVDETQVGMFVPRGYPLATIVSGGWEARMVVDEDALKRSGISAGDELTFRSVTRPEELIPARVVSVLPSGSRRIAPLPLTHLGGGDIAVDPRTHEATQPFFEVRLALSPSAEEFVRGGMTGAVRLGTGAESIGHAVMRRVVRFWNRLVQEQ